MPKAAKSASSSKRRRKPTAPGAADEQSAGRDDGAAEHDNPFADSLGKIFDFQRKVFEVSTAAARSAVDHPASKRVQESMTDSVQSGLRKLESVFDDRVAAALALMGMPSAEELRELIAKVDALAAKPGRKPAKSRKGR